MANVELARCFRESTRRENVTRCRNCNKILSAPKPAPKPKIAINAESIQNNMDNLLPKLLIVNISSPSNALRFIEYYLSGADLFLADLPEKWSIEENCAFYTENPVRTTPEDMLRLAEKECPYIQSNLPMFDVRVA